jgi:membrane-anchored glycerophosphoryl diester phosphodiesterase (GDPDase)
MKPETFSLRAFAWSIVPPILVAALSAPIIVAAHRSVLTDDARASYDFRSRRNQAFMIAATGYLLILDAISLPVIATAISQNLSAWWWVVGFSLGIVGIVLSIRLLLVFPLIAIDQPSPFRRSIALTKGRWWRICAVTLIIPGLAMVAVVYVPTKFSAVLLPTLTTSHVVDLGTAIIGSIFYLTIPCALSFIYLWIRNHEATGPSPANVAETR